MRLRKILAAWVVAIAAGGCVTAELKLNLEKGWVLKAGDEAAWADPEFDDGDWTPVEVGVPWEKAGFPDLDGYAWYRVRVVIPARWEESRAVRDYGSVVLDLGAIDDVDETFFNGKKVGSMGSLPPKYKNAWDKPRTYFIPAGQVKWGGENVIAVRVYDGQGDGGMYPGPVRLRTPSQRDTIDLRFYPESENGVYPAGEKIRVTVKLENRSRVDVAGTLECVWKTDRTRDDTVLNREAGEIVVEGHGIVSRTFEYLPEAPGAYPVHVYLKIKGIKDLHEYLVPGYDMARIEGVSAKPDDFDEFWKARINELAKVDPEYEVESRPDKSTEEADVYLVTMRSYRGVRVSAWYTVPKGAGPHPALLGVAGYGGGMRPGAWYENVATLALDIRGQGISRADVDPKGKEYMYVGLTGDPTDYVYVGAYLDCIRAVDFLCTRPEVDPKRIAVQGGSQGGGLSLVTAALDSRIVACAADVPFLCSWPEYAETAWWALDNFVKLLKKRKDLTREKLMRILSYIDAANFAGRVKCPVIVSMGLRDSTCPPRTIMAAYNRIRSEKSIYYYPYGGHGGGGSAHSDIRKKWLMTQFGEKN